jgi:hypothetical protein
MVRRNEQKAVKMKIWHIRYFSLSNPILIFCFTTALFFIIGCEDTYWPENEDDARNYVIYHDIFGYDIAYRVIGNDVYRGEYSLIIDYRISGNTIYSGGFGFTIAYRIDGDRIYSGESGFNVAYRVINDVVYSDEFGFNAVYRIERQ